MEYLKNKKQIRELEEYVNSDSDNKSVQINLKYKLFDCLAIQHDMAVIDAFLTIKPFKQYHTFQIRIELMDEDKSKHDDREKGYTITKNNIFESYSVSRHTTDGLLWWNPMCKTPIKHDELREIYDKIVPEIKGLIKTL